MKNGKKRSTRKNDNSIVNEEHRVAMEKIKELGVKIQKIHEERKLASPMSKYNNSLQLNSSTVKSRKAKKNSKHAFYHPNLDYVYAEVTHSPYLTPPEQNYSPQTVNTCAKLRKLKVANKGKQLRDIQDAPCDVEKAETEFIRNIIDYKVRFAAQKDANNYIPDVHAKPRPAYIVYPNKYKPLEGHTGKLSNVQPYLLFNPEVKYEVPPNSSGILTMADYRRYLQQLNGQLPLPKQVARAIKDISMKNVYSSAGNQGENNVQSLVDSGSRPSSARLRPLNSHPELLERPSTTPSIEQISQAPSLIRRESSEAQLSTSSTPRLQRQGSGSFQAHNARAGPEYFLSQKAVQKSYKEFIASFSKDGIDGEQEFMPTINLTGSPVKNSEIFGNDKNDLQIHETMCSTSAESKASTSNSDDAGSFTKSKPLGTSASKGDLADSKSESSSKMSQEKRILKRSASEKGYQRSGSNCKSEGRTRRSRRSDSELVTVGRENEADAKVDLHKKCSSKTATEEDADLSIYQDDDDFESCTSQKIADDSKEIGGRGVMSPLSMPDNGGPYFDTEDVTDVYVGRNLENKEESSSDSRNIITKKNEVTTDDDLSMPLGLDTKSMILKEKYNEDNDVTKISAHDEKERVIPPHYSDDDFDKEQDDYGQDDFEPVSASSSPLKHPQIKTETSNLAVCENDDVFVLSDDD